MGMGMYKFIILLLLFGRHAPQFDDGGLIISALDDDDDDDDDANNDNNNNDGDGQGNSSAPFFISFHFCVTQYRNRVVSCCCCCALEQKQKQKQIGSLVGSFVIHVIHSSRRTVARTDRTMRAAATPKAENKSEAGGEEERQ